MPVTIPEVPTVAIPVLPLVQAPPPPSLKDEVAPAQNERVPPIAPGAAYTFTVVVAVHPVPAWAKVMTAVPPVNATPDTTPVPDTTLAVDGLPLVHVPVPDGSLNVVAEPGQTFVVPVMADGKGLTVMVVDVVHAAGVEKVITVVAGLELPVDIADKLPLNDPIVATLVLLLLHVPLKPSVRDSVPPWHTGDAPDIAEGKGFTVTVLDVLHPVDAAVNVITEVAGVELPVATPVIDPVIVLIVATPVLALVQVPRVAASVNVVVTPWHIESAPPIAGVAALTVTVLEAVPQEVV